MMSMIYAWNCKLGKDQSFQKRTGLHCQPAEKMDGHVSWFGVSRNSQELRAAGLIQQDVHQYTTPHMNRFSPPHSQRTKTISLWPMILHHFAWMRETTGGWRFAAHCWKLKAKDAPDPCARHSQQDLTTAGNVEKTIDKLNSEREKTTYKATISHQCTNGANIILVVLRHATTLAALSQT